MKKKPKKKPARGRAKKIIIYVFCSLLVIGLSFFMYSTVNIKNDSIYMKPLPDDMLKAPAVNLYVSKNSYSGSVSPSGHGIEVNAPIRKSSFAKTFSYFSCQNIEQIENKQLKQKVAGILDDYGMASFEVISGVLSVMKADEWLKPVEATSIDVRTGETIKLRDIFADNVDASYEINKKVSYYLLSHAPNGFRYDLWEGISMDTPFVVYEDFMNKNSYLILFFDDKTPVLKGQTLIFNLRDFGNNGDNIAYYNRFPAFSNYEDFYNQTQIKADQVNIASLYYYYGQKKDPWKFYEKYKPVGWMDPSVIDDTELPINTPSSSPLPSAEPTPTPTPTPKVSLPAYDGRFDMTYFSGTTSDLLKIPLSEYVLDKNNKVKFQYPIEGAEPSFGTKNLLKDLLNEFYVYELPFGLGS